MLLSLEIPVLDIELFLPLTDFPFGLAQLFLRRDFPGSPVYHAKYQDCLLDNGMYELGESLSVSDLLKAAEVACPRAVIAPDWMNNLKKTIAATEDLIRQSEHYRWTVGGVVQGKNLQERVECFRLLQGSGCRPICFPFRTPRASTIEFLCQSQALREREWYHLLGMQSLKELSTTPGPGCWSIDTSKPFKGYSLTDKKIRGRGRLDVHKDLPVGRMAVALWNIAYMRKVMRDA